MSSKDVMSSKEADNSPGLYPVKEQWPVLRSWTRAQNQIFEPGKTPPYCLRFLSSYVMRSMNQVLF